MKFRFVCCILLFSLLACQKEPGLFISNCESSILSKLEMVPYNGETLGCEFYLEKFSLDNLETFALGSNCFDMVFLLRDCKGNPATFESDEERNHYLERATRHGIIAYRPK